jgi:hypothetical protein
MLIRFLKRFATVWFVVAGLFIFASMLMIWHSEGFGRVQEIFSPFNVLNFVAVVITLAPGIGAHMLAERLESRQGARQIERRAEP